MASPVKNYWSKVLLPVCYCSQHIWTTITTTILWPFFWDHLGEPVPEENFWTLWCKGRLTEADTQTIWLGATTSGLTRDSSSLLDLTL